jgi:hypothetical protein
MFFQAFEEIFYIRVMNWMMDAVLGFVISLLGVSLPGLINMTAVKVAMERSQQAAWRFCLGACITIFFQAWLAIAFGTYLSKHTEIIDLLKGTGIFIFLLLSVVFFIQAIRSKVRPENTRTGDGLPIMLGMGIAAMNFLNIPFYLSAGTVLEGNGYITIYFPFYFFFVGGLTLGSGAALALYVLGAGWIVKNARFLARHLNYFLGGLFLLIAIIQMVQFYNG